MAIVNLALSWIMIGEENGQVPISSQSQVNPLGRTGAVCYKTLRGRVWRAFSVVLVVLLVVVVVAPERVVVVPSSPSSSNSSVSPHPPTMNMAAVIRIKK